MTRHLRLGGWVPAWGKTLTGPAFLLLFTGCANQPEPPPVVSVKGKVVCQGKAVPAVLIKFWPRQADPQMRPVQTTSSPNGEFSLSCPKGSYKVTVANLPVNGAGPGLAEGAGVTGTAGSPAVTVPGGYADRMDTPFTVEVPECGTDQILLTINK